MSRMLNALVVSVAHVATPVLTYVTAVALSAITAHAQVQPPEVEWEKTYGGKTGEDGATSVQQTKDGGYIVAGVAGGDVYLVKTDALGNMVWENSYGGSRGNSVQQTTDGGYIVAGYLSFGVGNHDVYLVKTDALGNMVWSNFYGGERADLGFSVQQTQPDGGYIVAGYTASFGNGFNEDVYLVKTDAAGKKVWENTYGGTGNDKGQSVQQTQDGGYIVAGWGGDRQDDVYLVKTDAGGKKVWENWYGGALGGDRGFSVQQTQPDGGYIVAGKTDSFTDEGNVYLVKTDASGTKVWENTYGAAMGGNIGFSVQQTQDGGYIVAGDAISGGFDVYLVKTDTLGEMLWEKRYGGTRADRGFSVQQTQPDGGYIVAGYTGSEVEGGEGDPYLIKFCPEQPDKLPPGFFIRGDAAPPSCTLNITDVIFILNHLFLGGTAPPCSDAADVDDSGMLNLTDAVYLLNYLFLGGRPPPPPFPSYGTDPTLDTMDCTTA